MPSPMDFEISVSSDGEVLLVTFSGTSTSANSRAMTKRYFDIVLQSGRKKVLADLRALNGRLSGGETYFLVRDLPVQPVPQGIRTAVLEAKDHSAYAQFLETTAVNAGVPLKSFTDREAALAWLRAP